MTKSSGVSQQHPNRAASLFAASAWLACSATAGDDGSESPLKRMPETLRRPLRLIFGAWHGKQLLIIGALAQRIQILVVPHHLDLGRRFKEAGGLRLFQQLDGAGSQALGLPVLFRLDQLGIVANSGRTERTDTRQVIE